MYVNISVDVDLDDVAKEVSWMETEEIIEFIKNIDAIVGDLVFTKDMYSYFKKEMRKHNKCTD